jgi:hypothetical protein
MAGIREGLPAIKSGAGNPARQSRLSRRFPKKHTLKYDFG